VTKAQRTNEAWRKLRHAESGTIFSRFAILPDDERPAIGVLVPERDVNRYYLVGTLADVRAYLDGSDERGERLRFSKTESEGYARFQELLRAPGFMTKVVAAAFDRKGLR